MNFNSTVNDVDEIYKIKYVNNVNKFQQKDIQLQSNKII